MEKVLARYGHLPEAGEVAVLQCHLMVSDEENLEMQLPKVIALAQEYTKKYVDYAHEFKNFINEQTHPTFEVSWADSKEVQAGRALYPETEVVLPVKFRNVQKASVQLYRLSNISANELEKADASNHVQQRLQQILKKHGAQVPLFTKQLRPSPAPAYEEREDSIAFQAPKSGLYLMRLTVDDGTTDWHHAMCRADNDCSSTVRADTRMLRNISWWINALAKKSTTKPTWMRFPK